MCGGTGGPRRKVWTQTKILSPHIRYFVANQDLSRFTHFLEIFGQKKCLFWSKTVFLGQEVHYYMVYIAHVAKLINMRLKICMAIFAITKRLPTCATLQATCTEEFRKR